MENDIVDENNKQCTAMCYLPSTSMTLKSMVSYVSPTVSIPLTKAIWCHWCVHIMARSKVDKLTFVNVAEC